MSWFWSWLHVLEKWRAGIWDSKELTVLMWALFIIIMGISSFCPEGLESIWERAAHLPELPWSHQLLTSAWLGEAVALEREKKCFTAVQRSFQPLLFVLPLVLSCAWCILSFRSKDRSSVCSIHHTVVLARSWRFIYSNNNEAFSSFSLNAKEEVTYRRTLKGFLEGREMMCWSWALSPGLQAQLWTLLRERRQKRESFKSK